MDPRLRNLFAALLLLGPALGAAPSAACTVAAVTPEAAAPPAVAPDEDAVPEPLFSASVDATVASRYLFQGYDYSDGHTVVQPNLVANLGPFSAVCWANYQADIGEMNEVDLSLKLTRSFGRFSASPGYTNLRYPNRDWDPSQEVFADLSVESPLSPSLSIHYDFDAGDGTYATLGLSHPLGSVVSVGSNVFYQHHYYGMTGVPSVEFKVSAAFSYARMTLTPSLSRFATTDNGDFTDAARLPAQWLFAVNLVPNR